MNKNDKAVVEQPAGERVSISPPNFKVAAFGIVGTVPLVVNAFSNEARAIIKETQESGQRAKKGRKRDPKDFKALFESSRHLSTEGWDGFPASAFRNGLISACRMAGFAMTRAKLSLFIEADGFTPDGVPLVKFSKGKPKQHESYVRNATGVVDLRSRAMFDPGWEMELRIRYDADQFSLGDVANLLLRVGAQVGIGNGRPDSSSSAGCGWGLFTLKESKR